MARRTGRSSSVGRGSGKFKRSTGRAKSVSGRKSGRTSGAHRKIAKPTGHELVPVICSECFEELAFDTGVKTDSLTCPVCEHTASRPNDAELHHISSMRKAERTNFMIAAILFGVAGASVSAWSLLMKNPANSMDGGLFWGPLSVAILSAFVLMGFIFKYEGNRHETYF
jgi:hypothetical protein